MSHAAVHEFLDLAALLSDYQREQKQTPKSFSPAAFAILLLGVPVEATVLAYARPDIKPVVLAIGVAAASSILFVIFRDTFDFLALNNRLLSVPQKLRDFISDLVLSSISVRISARRLKWVAAAAQQVDHLTFEQLAATIRDRLGSIVDQRKAIELDELINELLDEYIRDSCRDDQRYRIALGLMLERKLGRYGLSTYMSR
jgi:hypothetical protein